MVKRPERRDKRARRASSERGSRNDAHMMRNESISAEHQAMIDTELREALRFNPLAISEREELSACAWLGYLEAKKRFDPRQSKSFSHFARQRVRGAIFDGLADLSPLGRSALRAVKRHVQLKETLLVEPDEPVKNQQRSKSEAHSELINSEQEAQQKQVSSSLPKTFKERYQEIYLLAIATWAESLHMGGTNDPSRPYEERERRTEESELLSQAFGRLNESQRELLIALYDLRRIGDCAKAYAERHQLHRSTVSRRHAAAIDALRREVGAILGDQER